MKKKAIFLFVVCLLTIQLFGQEKQNNVNSKIEIVESPTSFENLLKPLNGKLIYIDIMASFCKPCISELKTSAELESYFKEKNIVSLFISLDAPKDIPQCIQHLEYNDVTGYFVSLHSKDEKESRLGSEILKLFFTDKDGNVSLSIPKYAIVNKQGELVVRNAAKRSNTSALIKQLEEWN